MGATIAACAAEQPGPPRNVILIVVDTLRADHLGVYGYDRRPTSPGIDRWAQRAAVFDNAFSTSSWTLTSFGSIITGQLPSRHGAGLRVYLDAERNLTEMRPGETPGESPGGGDTREDTRGADDDDLDVIDDPAAAADLYVALDDELPTLASVFADAGYRTGAVTNNTFLDPMFGVARGFAHYDHRPLDGRRSRDAGEAVDDALEWIDGRDDEPFFLLLHLLDPHAPYEAPGAYGGRFSDDLIEQIDGRFRDTELRTLRRTVRRGRPGWQLSVQIQQATYDEEIAYLDSEIDRFFARLRDLELLDDAVVLFTADHGEEFWDHQQFGHGRSMYSEVVRVPMLLWAGEVVAGRIDAAVSLADVMPTVLEAAGLSSGDGLSGQSLWRLATQPRATPAPAREARAVYLERTRSQDDLTAVVRWPLKAIFNDNSGSMSLYDLLADPLERNDLAASEPAQLRQLRGALNRALLAAEQAAGERGIVTLDETVMRELRALGYVR